jgi:hypothetical protein
MTGRSGVRLAVGILAAFAAGCGSSRPFQSGVVARAADKNPPGPVDTRYGTAVVPAAASSWPQHQPPAPPAATWPQPEYNRAGFDDFAPGQPAGQPTGQPTGQPLGQPAGLPAPLPLGGPPTVRQPAYYGGGYDRPNAAPPPSPNTLQRPTAAGGVFDLGPYETPIDRAVELARKIDQVNRENLALLARIRQLEAVAEARETALSETLRDVQNASDEVTRTRNELQTLRKDLAALKTRVMQVEKDEAETLKAVITAIEKLLEQAPYGGTKKN